MSYPKTVYQRRIDLPPAIVPVTVSSDAELTELGGPVYETAADASLGVNPLHVGIVYPATVYQKIPTPPGYVAVIVADEPALLALEGPVFFTIFGALRYQPPPEQPIAHIKRTDNLEQFRIGISTMGADIPVPVARENPLPGTFVRP